MAASTPHAVTRLLLAWSQGEQAALEKLAPLVYAELRRIRSSVHEPRAPRPHSADH